MNGQENDGPADQAPASQETWESTHLPTAHARVIGQVRPETVSTEGLLPTMSIPEREGCSC